MLSTSKTFNYLIMNFFHLKLLTKYFAHQYFFKNILSINSYRFYFEFSLVTVCSVVITENCAKRINGSTMSRSF